ncbi:polysaccharide pyruvyl transferase family protein [Amedibacillus dolichus]|uniref:Polysaccharide pyruvyl transferase domain-containing protein n=1 Tax=Amedibacillus dolichus DSM 3991 TaxID=428127 RepID=A8RE99_9FIRM|nr:polysaccharide pyruvyl transferase family protein [Amedibacillus dolichus]EDP10488.1 hypothetical protein EUBDOL_01732 [Amedibacillus dolichus DSM 3991]
MKTVVLFDPSIRSLNMGDHIIMKSAKDELKEIISDKFLIHCATHQPPVTCYQNTRLNPKIKIYDDAQFKFICGSNLLWKNLMIPRPTFNVNLFNTKIYENSILMGVGTNSSNKNANLYTRIIYNRILSEKFYHSVRDERTKRFVESLGFKAINTGCPTMWKFNKEFCKQIPTHKSSKVVFTLTDYSQEQREDQELINILVKNYEKVYFWLQGASDEEYFDSLANTKGIIKVAPTLEAYEAILNEGDIDYVGTRLHAGMYAMQHKVRTIILAIDNRVRDMKETYHINTVERTDINSLDSLVNSTITTQISINENNINEWMSQFK